MYYYYKDGIYVGCGNEDSMEGCAANKTPPVLPKQEEVISEPITDPTEKLKAFLESNPDVKAILQ